MPGKRKRNIYNSFRRDLTPPRPSKRGFHNQAQSSFFRLPREIRDIISEHIFTFPVIIHLAYVGALNRKFRSFLCSLPENAQLKPQDCHTYIHHTDCTPRVNGILDVPHQLPADARQDARVIALLQSCRRIYAETIDLLYTKNTFYIENPRTLLELPNSMPQSRLSSFRQLYLESPLVCMGGCTNIRQPWGEAIKELAKLDGLQSLCVVLRVVPPWEPRMLMPPLDEARLSERLDLRLLEAPPWMQSECSCWVGWTSGCMALPDDDDPDL